MQIYLAAIDALGILNDIPDNYIAYGLISYYSIMDDDKINLLKRKCQHVLIDSGAFSFQRGRKANLDQFTDRYINFVRNNANDDKVTGFFEMDVDAITGYQKVLEYRQKLMDAGGNKIIPVWHKGRGLDEFYRMCDERKGYKVAVSAISNRDIGEHQYNLFINEAHRRGCSIHILGYTRFSTIKTLNLGLTDSVDSSSWLQHSIYATLDIPNRNLTTHDTIGLNVKGDKTRDYKTANFFTYHYLQRQFFDFDNSIPISQLK
jgi:hypothetical protein